MKDARVDAQTGVIWKVDAKGKEVAIGLQVGSTPMRGFATPSRKFEIYAPEVERIAAKMGQRDDGLPTYQTIPSHQGLPLERFILTTFKWNVHTQGRTASQKYLAEIVHDNPMWINSSSAARLKLKTGDTVELTTYRPVSGTLGDQAYRGTGAKVGSAKVKVFVTDGIHPRVLAISNSLGWITGGRASEGKGGRRTAIAARSLAPDAARAFGPAPVVDDLDYGLWWDKKNGGRGNGVNVNALLPINPQPLVGMQSWFDTVCSIRKV
jgi:anaerobic selenocysteine-containing dehydrogenase